MSLWIFETEIFNERSFKQKISNEVSSLNEIKYFFMLFEVKIVNWLSNEYEIEVKFLIDVNSIGFFVELK